MDVINRTPYSLEVARAQLFYRDLLMTTVICKSCWKISPGQTLSLAPAPPILHEDQAIHGIVFEGEVVPVKHGCDFAIVGDAQSPDGRPTTSMIVQAQIGSRRSTMRISGDRAWVPRPHGGFSPSKPQPFMSMPLSYDRAFGGSRRGDFDMDEVHPQNPSGKGLVSREKDVAGSPLPNIEWEDELLTDWRARPRVAGWAPLPRASMIRGMRGIDVDLEAQTTQMEPLAFNFAQPSLLFDAYPPEAPVKIRGLSRDDGVMFRLPRFEVLADLTLHHRTFTFSLVPDTVVIFPSIRELWITSRIAFIYQFRPERQRTLTVREGREASSVDLPTLGQLRAEPNPAIPLEAPDDVPFVLETLLEKYPLQRIIDNLPVCASP